VASTCQPATARALGCRAQATPNAVAHARPRTALADGGGAGRRRGHQETSSKVSAEEATNRQLVRGCGSASTAAPARPAAAGVGGDVRVRPADIAEGHEAGGGAVEDMGQPPGLGAGPDDEGPERQAPGPFQPDLIAAPVSAGEQLQQQGEHPGGPHPGPARTRNGTSSSSPPGGQCRRWPRRRCGGIPRAARGAGARTGRRPGTRPATAGGDDDGERFPGGIGRLSWRR
jgi:hypothetical protein